MREKLNLLALILLFLVLDMASKSAARQILTYGEPLPIIPGVFNLTLAYNTGAAFSLFEGQPGALLVITTLIFLILLGVSLFKPVYLKGERLAYAMILGGALGNLLDRLTLGKVIDFLDVAIIHYPVFNLADSFIFCGVITLLIIHLRPQPAARPPRELQDEQPPGA